MKKNPNMKDMVGKNKSSQSPVIIDSTGTEDKKICIYYKTFQIEHLSDKDHPRSMEDHARPCHY